MSDAKVSELVTATSVGGSDLFYLVQTNTSKKITAATLFANAANAILSGRITLGGTPQTLGAPGIVNINTPITQLTADAIGGTLQIPQGSDGQVKVVALTTTAGGAYTFNTANIAGGSTVTLDSVGDVVLLVYTNGKWYPIGSTTGGGIDLTNVSSNIIPSADSVYDLGSPSNQWNSLYVSNNTIFIGGTPLTVVDGDLVIGSGEESANIATVSYVDAALANVGGANTGNITFANSTISASNEDQIIIQAKDDEGVPTVKLSLEPEYSTAQLSAYSSESTDTFTLANGDFATGVWQDNGFGNGVVSFTGAQTIGDFFQNTLLGLTPENVSIIINSEPAFIWNGGTSGAGTSTPGFGTNPIVPQSPIAITSIQFVYRSQSFISVNYDNQEIRLNAQNAGIRFDATSGIQVFGDQNIEFQSGADFSISAGEDINISNGSDDNISLSTGDFTVSAFDDITITGRDSFRFRNRSNVAPIRIITDDDDNEYTWEFGADGTLEIPGDIIVDGDIAGNEIASTLNILAQLSSNTFIQLNDAIDSSIRTQANLEIRTNGTDPLTWVFDTNGLLTTPSDVNIEGGLTLSQTSITGNRDFGTVNINSAPNPNAYVQLNETGDSYFGAESNVLITTGGDFYEWNFGADSTLTLPGNLHFYGCSISAINSVSNSSGDGLNASTLQIVPDNSLFNNDQYIIIDPTEPDHIHIRGGGAIDNCSAKLIVGGENSHFAVQAGQDPSVSIRANNQNWNFSTDGTLSAPGSISSDGIISTGKSKFDKVVESFSGLVDPTGIVTFDCADSHIFNVTSINTNFTANVVNLNLDNGEATSITLVLNQGATAYVANAFQISGATQTIKWQANAEPTGNINAVDIQTFSILNVNGNYLVLGQLTTFG